MDKKLNFTDFSEFFAKTVGASVADAELFVHAFFDTIVEGLVKDGSVKINGLGTFKVVEVESRESVNINTGERFEINGHKRLTFIPADSLKETINAPFAMFEPVEVDDDIDDDDNDDKETLTEINANDENSVSEEYIEENNSIAENVVAEQQVIVEEEIIATEETEIPVAGIDEEIPKEFTEERNITVSTMEIEEEMPIEESDYVTQNIAEETIEEEVKIEEEETIIPEEAAIEESKEEKSMAVVEENEKRENEPDSETIATQKEEAPKKEIIIPDKKEEIFFDTLQTKKKRDNTPKLFILFVLIILCAAGAFVGLHFYNVNINSTGNAKEQIAVVEVVKTVKEDSITVNEADSIITTNDSTVNIATDSVDATNENIVVQQDTINETPQQPQKEEPTINVPKSFKIVDALAVRELSTIFVADTTDYKISGTICNHKVKSEETLIKISQKYYGDKRLWPYIVKYNNMIRPNDLACDMMLKIPRLTPKK